jgi:hypothetical protein
MNDQQTRDVVHVIRKGPRQEIRFSISQFKGREFADVRLFVPNHHGEWVPTVKGCTVGLEHLGELSEALTKLRLAAEQAAAMSLRDLSGPA